MLSILVFGPKKLVRAVAAMARNDANAGAKNVTLVQIRGNGKRKTIPIPLRLA